MKCVLNNKYINFCASITDKEIDDFKNAKQHYSDCYLMTSLESLSKIDNGRKILKNSIKRDDTNYNIVNCYFYTPSGTQEKYSVPVDTVTASSQPPHARWSIVA